MEEVPPLPASVEDEPPPLPMAAAVHHPQLPPGATTDAPPSFLDSLQERSTAVGRRIVQGVADFSKPDGARQPVATSDEAAGASPLKFDWKNWGIGGKTIFIAACVATVSMLIPWVDVGFASANGLSQCTFFFLGLFIYPVLMLLKNRSINLIGGIVCGGSGILLALGYIASKEIDFFGHSVNAAAGGPYAFLLCCVALIVGVVKYRPTALRS
jgi:hypothetical protein